MRAQRVVCVLVIGHLLAACGPPPPPDAVEAGAIRDAGGAFARLDAEGAFTLDVAGGEHLVCFTRSPREDVIGPDGCALETLAAPPVQLRVWTGESFDVEQLSVD